MSGHHHHDHEGHDHSHGHDDHSHDLTPALQSLLYQQIDFEGINTLNEAQPKTGNAIVKKTWAERLDDTPELQSDADEQILMHVPFTGQVKLHAILIRTSNSASAPQTLKLFRNRNDLDFTTASDLEPVQKLILPQTSDVVEVPLNRAHWNMTTSLTLFFEDNYGEGDEDVTRIGYLGFKGEFMALNREPVSVLYEAAANPSDHQAIAGLDGLKGGMQTGQ